MINFAIRDDDTNYFTKPQDLIDNYSRVWDICPVSLSVVPFHACTQSAAIPQKYWSEDGIFPIGENKELVQFLKEMIEKNKISIMLHGYSHKNNPDGYEFDTGNNLSNKIKEGREYLEELFNVKVTVFVPPHNSLSKKGLASVIDNKMHIVNVPSFRPDRRQFSAQNIIPFIKQKFFRLIHDNKYPHVLAFADHKEIGYYSLTPQITFDRLRKDFDFCREKDGSFILATHYWEFTAKQSYNQNILMGDVFYEFWEYVSRLDNINFISVNRIFES